MKRDTEVEAEDLEKSRWFDKDIFKVMALQKKLKVDGPEQARKNSESDADASDDEGQYLNEEAESASGSDEEMDEEDDESQGKESEAEDDGESDEDEDEGDEEAVDYEDDSSEGAAELAGLGGEYDDDIDPELQIDKGYMEDLELGFKGKNEVKKHNLEQKIKRKLKKKEERDQKAQDEDDEESDPENEYAQRVRDLGEQENALGIDLNSSEEEFEDESYDGRYDITKPDTEMEKRKKRLKKAQEKRDKKEGKSASQIQIVPQKKFEDFDKDELAMDLAIAKKMLRKKERRELLEMGVNRYNYPEKPEELPEWFRDDETKHSQIIEPVTKEEVLAEKLRLKEINAKPPKKVIEAKYRNKLRLVKKMKKFKSQADQIFETEGLDQKTKVQTIDKLKRKTLFMANKQTKKVIPVRGFRTSAPVSRKTAGKRYKTVDTRLKKDTKAQKRQERQVARGIKKSKGPSSSKKFNRRRR